LGEFGIVRDIDTLSGQGEPPERVKLGEPSGKKKPRRVRAGLSAGTGEIAGLLTRAGRQSFRETTDFVSGVSKQLPDAVAAPNADRRQEHQLPTR
jgi:hypothetical protein